MKIITSWDDGRRDDLRLAELLKHHGFEAIFFISNTTELSDSEIRDLSKDFEIGGHTVSHNNNMKELDYEEQFDEINDNRNWLKKLTGQDLKWFCYPRGRYNKETIQAVRKSGFLYARTTLIGSYKVSRDNYRIPTSAHVYPNRVECKGVPFLDYAYDILEKANEQENDGLFHLWGHSWEISKFGMWDELDALLRRIKQYSFEQ